MPGSAFSISPLFTKYYGFPIFGSTPKRIREHTPSLMADNINTITPAPAVSNLLSISGHDFIILLLTIIAERSTSTSVPAKIGTNQPDSYYRNQAEKFDKENKQLKAKLDTIERENRDLKKSLYELSFRYDHLSSQLLKPLKPFNIDHLVVENAEDNKANSMTSSAGYVAGQNATARTSSTTLRKPVVDQRHLFCRQTLKGHNAAVYAVNFSPCGKYISSGSFDKSVRLWDSATGQPMGVLQEHQ
ncbi:hypothetical protein PROFUN_16878, partial [Planoprotostelium fungivorum]